MQSRRLPLRFYRRPVREVCRDLLGRTLCRRLPRGRVLRGRIVEVEAYDGFEDRASHASRGRTERNAPMFEVGGIAYVYLVYGVHHCLNIVTGEAGYPAAILFRATESPLAGISASGPGRLTKVFQVDRRQNGLSLAGRELWLEEGRPVANGRVRRTPRIGVDYAGSCAQRLFRYVIADHPSLSGPRRLNREAATSL